MQLHRLSPVLVLTNHMVVGGAEVYVLTVSAWLAEHGVRTVVAASPGDLVERFHPDVAFEPVPLTDVRLGLPTAVARVRSLVRRLRPRVILANSLVTAWVGRLATWPWNVPVLQVGHGWPEDRYTVVAPLSKVADTVVAVSDEVERRFLAQGFPQAKLDVVRNGIDLAPFAPMDEIERDAVRADFGAGPRDVVITTVGRFTEQKAQHWIPHVAARLRDTHPHLRVRFGIVGYGPREDELRELIARLDVADRVRLLLKRRDVPDLLRGSDILFNCSNWEGMPLSTIEAMAAGLPLVCTDVEGVGALVQPDNGRLVPVGDPAAMAEVLSELVSDDVLRQRLGRASRRRAEQDFSRHRMCSDLARVMLRQLHRRGL